MIMPKGYSDKEGMSANRENIEMRSEENTAWNIALSGKKKLKLGLLPALMVLTIIYIVCSKYQQSPVVRHASAPKSTGDYAVLIQVRSDQASRRNLNAMKLFEYDVNRAITEHESKLKNVANAAAENVAEYESVGRIIYFMARDKVKGRHDTEAFLDRETKPFMAHAIQELAQDVGEAVRKLEYELRLSTMQFAVDLAAISPSQTGSVVNMDVDENRMDIQQSLRNLGFNVTGIVVAASFDAAVIAQSQLFRTVLRQISSIAARLFGKQIAWVGTSVVLAGVDGPLPVGDILAIAGILWTAHDINESRRTFKNEINISLDNLLMEAEHNIYKQAVAQQKDLVREYQKLQEQIGSQTLDQ